MLGRPERPFARKHRRERDDRRFIIATEDTYAPKQYFGTFTLRRISVHVVGTDDARPSGPGCGRSTEAIREEDRQRGEIMPLDEFWVVVDTDHYAHGHHVASFSRALKEAKDAGFGVAVSNPCFELWLLLHVADAPKDMKDCSVVEDALRHELGAYSKRNVPVERLMPGVSEAIDRAEQLDTGVGGWPQTTGTQVHFLVRQLRQFEGP